MTTATREEQRIRLDGLVEQLKARGVVDIKLSIVKGACFDDALRDTIETLQAIVDKRHTLIKSNYCNDSVRNCG